MNQAICPVHYCTCERHPSGVLYCPQCEARAAVAVPVAEAAADPKAFIDGMTETVTIHRGLPTNLGRRPQHTPGPWLLRSKGRVIVALSADGFDLVSVADCRTVIGPVEGRRVLSGPIEVQQANGLMIAASPRLLDACRVALRWLLPIHGPCSEVCRYLQQSIDLALKPGDG